mmetsp:Transcript_44207/g.133922  ORF Transcript_44207/g.133922 Transcript_44207/m.133922 type:complete len:208 (-) Transcript_44207:823-1446(-)
MFGCCHHLPRRRRCPRPGAGSGGGAAAGPASRPVGARGSPGVSALFAWLLGGLRAELHAAQGCTLEGLGLLRCGPLQPLAQVQRHSHMAPGQGRGRHRGRPEDLLPHGRGILGVRAGRVWRHRLQLAHLSWRWRRRQHTQGWRCLALCGFQAPKRQRRPRSDRSRKSGVLWDPNRWCCLRGQHLLALLPRRDLPGDLQALRLQVVLL